ncbi:MAG TPA: DUF11 domain-containing protein, partial [Caldisericia bacterium]|nr:DUF11 domain-containing protein [Caldisericia bacterium]
VINIEPTPVVNAGADEDIPEESINYQLSGLISGPVTTGSWSGGTGSYVPNNQSLSPLYIISDQDRMAGQVVFILTSDDPVGICGPVSDTVVVNLLGLEDLIDTPTKIIVSTSDTMTSDVANGSLAFPRPLAIGEKVKFRLYAPLSESTTISFEVVDQLEAGFEYVSGSAFVSYIADVVPSFAGDFSGIQNSVVPALPFPISRISYVGNEVSFDFGSIINNDGDQDNEIAIIDFEAIVLNNVGNINGSVLENNFETVADRALPTELFSNSNSVYVTLVEPDVSIQKTFTPDVVLRGKTSSFSIVVSNQASSGSTASAYNILVDDILDDWINVDSIIVDFNALSENSGSAFTNNSTLNAGFATGVQDEVSILINHLPLDGEATITVFVGIDPDADPLLLSRTITNTASVLSYSSPGSLDPDFIRTYESDAQDDLTVVKPTLLISKSDSQDPVNAGAPMNFTILIENIGTPNFDATNVMLTDILPANFVFDTAISTQGVCSELSGMVSCSLDTIASGESVTVTILGYFESSTLNGFIGNNIAYVTSQEGNHGNDGNDTPTDSDDERAEEATTVIRSADLSISIVEALDPVFAGCDVQTYVICVKNNGPSDASNISALINVVHPMGVVLTPVPTNPPFNYMYNFSSLSAGDSVCWTIEAEVGLGTIAGSMISVDASVSAQELDPNQLDNMNTESTSIIMRDFSGSFYVDSSNNNMIQDGASWETAYNNLQDALHLACIGDTVHVAQGTYYPDEGMVETEGDRSHFFELKGGVTYLGGYPSGGDGLRNPKCNLTILSGDIDMNGDSSGNTYNVVKTIDYLDTIIFDGFIIEHGNAIPIGEEGGAWWDGSLSDEALLIVRNTIFRNNFAVQGGAFYGEGTRDLHMSYTEFFNNFALTTGGGAYVGLISAADTALLRFENVLWHHNFANQGGGLAGQTAQVTNEHITLVNNTFSQNSPDGFYNNTLSPVSIINTIIWNNSGQSITGGNTPEVINSIIQGGYLGTNVKDEDPLFVDPDNNFRIVHESPALEMGLNSAVQSVTDLDGFPRIINSFVDIGAYEFILNCDSITLYVLEDGSVPSLPIDSFIITPLSSNIILVVNGIQIDSVVEYSCDMLGNNLTEIFVIDQRCQNPDTLYHCVKPVIVLDTFPKDLSGIEGLNLSLDEMCMAIVTPDMVLSNISGCRNAFKVTLEYPDGTNVYEPANK